MRLTRKVITQIEEEVVFAILCNGCGKSMVTHSYDPDKANRVTERVCYNGLDASVEGNMKSSVLEDTIKYEFSLCEPCCVKLFDGFKIQPTTSCYMGDCIDERYATDEQKKEYAAFVKEMEELELEMRGYSDGAGSELVGDPNP
jgi:hypothetical protein